MQTVAQFIENTNNFRNAFPTTAEFASRVQQINRSFTAVHNLTITSTIDAEGESILIASAPEVPAEWNLADQRTDEEIRLATAREQLARIKATRAPVKPWWKRMFGERA